MCTGKRFELHLAVVLGFDTEDEAREAAAIYRTVTDAVSQTAAAPGGLKANLRTLTEPATSGKAN